MDKTISFTNSTNSIVTSNRILYTPSSFARSSLLTLQEIGTLQALKPHTSSRDNLQSYLFFMLNLVVESWFIRGRSMRQEKAIVYLSIASFHTPIPQIPTCGRFRGSISMEIRCRGFMRSIWSGEEDLFSGLMIWNLSSSYTRLSTISLLPMTTSGI